MTEFVNDMAAQFVVESHDPRTRYERLMGALFPCKRCPPPDAPENWKDCITTRTVNRLSWGDWFRVILTGVVCVDVKTATQNEVGMTMTEAVCYIGTSRDWK